MLFYLQVDTKCIKVYAYCSDLVRLPAESQEKVSLTADAKLAQSDMTPATTDDVTLHAAETPVTWPALLDSSVNSVIL